MSPGVDRDTHEASRRRGEVHDVVVAWPPVTMAPSSSSVRRSTSALIRSAPCARPGCQSVAGLPSVAARSAPTCECLPTRSGSGRNHWSASDPDAGSHDGFAGGHHVPDVSRELRVDLTRRIGQHRHFRGDLRPISRRPNPNDLDYFPSGRPRAVAARRAGFAGRPSAAGRPRSPPGFDLWSRSRTPSRTRRRAAQERRSRGTPSQARAP